MKLLSVIVNECSEYIYHRLNKEMSCFRKEQILMEQNIYNLGKITEFEFSVVESTMEHDNIEHTKNIFKQYMANGIADIIIHELEEKQVKKIILDQYYYFTPTERQSISNYFHKIQESEECKHGEGFPHKISKKAKILQQIIDYLAEHDTINIDGFLSFRLQNYSKELEENIDKAVEDFLMEKEYNEFIRLLRYFVEIQDAKIDTLNILIGEDGKYHLYDKLYRMINNEYLEDLASEMADKDISYDDLLISSLITLAPKNIIIHFTTKIKKKEIIETIKNVFFDRVRVCSGCEFCVLAKNVKQE